MRKQGYYAVTAMAFGIALLLTSERGFAQATGSGREWVLERIETYRSDTDPDRRDQRFVWNWEAEGHSITSRIASLDGSARQTVVFEWTPPPVRIGVSTGMRLDMTLTPKVMDVTVASGLGAAVYADFEREGILPGSGTGGKPVFGEIWLRSDARAGVALTREGQVTTPRPGLGIVGPPWTTPHDRIVLRVILLHHANAIGFLYHYRIDGTALASSAIAPASGGTGTLPVPPATPPTTAPPSSPPTRRATGGPTARIVAGIPTRLSYTVVARNLSGAPVENPIVRDNGNVLNNDDAVKTGPNPNTLGVGETWTWTYDATVTGTAGQDIVNTVTIEGPDNATRDTNPANNTASTTVTVVPPPPEYDLSVTKTVTAAPAPTGPIAQTATERPTQTIDQLDEWVVANSGGYLGTRDPWDISALPQGVVFDIEFDARSVPDRYVVQYPDGTTVLDTGWRGVQSYVDRNPNLYPGGLSGPGRGEATAFFTKGAHNSFVVYVEGPEQGTVWGYRIRARRP